MIFLTYYLALIGQLFLPSLVYLNLLIAIYVLYIEILKVNDDLFKIFLIIAPSLSPIVYNNLLLNNSIYLFFLSVDPVFIASIFYLIRNCILIRFDKIQFIFILYIAILLYAIVHLFVLYTFEQDHNQGMTYGFRAVVYLATIFTVYKNGLTRLKDQIIKIIIFSIILILIKIFLDNFDNLKLTGHLIFLAAAFPVIIIFYRANFSNVLIYLISIIALFFQNLTILTVLLLSHILVFFKRFNIRFKRYNLIFNRITLIFLINFQVIILISIFNLDFFTQSLDPNSYFYKKLLFDRFPLFLSTLENLKYFEFESKLLEINYKNIITVDNMWDSGSHNYFLTMASKFGLVPATTLLLLVNIFLIKLYDKLQNIFKLKNNIFAMLYISFISSFAVWSSTGNAFMENMGFLFFLILGALNSSINLSEKR